MSSREKRTLVRTKARARMAHEEKIKALVDTFCRPLATTISAQSQSVSDLSLELKRKESDLRSELQKVSERVQRIEQNLPTIIKEEVEVSLAPFRKLESERRMVTENKVHDLSLAATKLTEELTYAMEKLRTDLKNLSEKIPARLEPLEELGSTYAQTKEKLDKLHADYTDYVSKQQDRDARNHMLEMMMKDMEGRLWPWRPNMDRSQSPQHSPRSASPPREPWDERRDWLPWPKLGPIKPPNHAAFIRAKLQNSTNPTPTPPERATPPETPSSGSRQGSRPGSARFRSRDPGPKGDSPSWKSKYERPFQVPRA